MKQKPSPKHCMMYFLLGHLYLSLRVVLVIGSSDTVDQGVCEYQDAFLMWPNVPTIEMNKAVYKGDTLIASWTKEFGLVEVPSYTGRLKQIGESAIIIFKATQSDSGTYKLIYYSPFTNKSEASINLQVRVPPTDYCIPFITRQGDTLKAQLPQDDCGIPMLIPKWINSTEILVGGIISVLKPEPRLQTKTYTACAVGTALKCFVGSPEKLCANSTLDVEVCASEDANLLFPNTPTSYAGDIKAKIWNKDNGIRLASWMASTDFITNPSYGDRLMPIGENSIKIRNATRNDTGFYTLVQTSGSTQNFLNSTVYLEVLVPPTNQCIPDIRHEGDSLRAILPLDGCGIPKLTTNWTSGTHKQISEDRISVHDLTLGSKAELYIVCAVGNSKRCSPVYSSNLCKNQTVSGKQLQDKTNMGLILWLIPVLIGIIIIIGTFAGLLYCKMIKKKNKHPTLKKNSGIENETGEGSALMDSELYRVGRTVQHKEFLENDTIPIIGVRDVQRHLLGQYKKMTTAAISPCLKENLVDVSQVYCELEIMSLGKGEEEIRESVTSTNVVFSSIAAENVKLIPSMIIGECGSGKTTWCKNLVHQWCQYHDNKESNLDVKDSNIPDIARFDILLYIQLKKKLEDPSFMEHVRKTLFVNATDYYEHTMNYILEHRGSVLLLIDGLDEVICNLDPIVNLLKEEEMFSCPIVLTSRHNGLECLQENGDIALRLFHIHGMSLERFKEYACKVLDILSLSCGEKINVEHFWKFVNHIQLLSMCHIPFLCLSLILIWIENKCMSGDLTDVLFKIVEYYLRHAMRREWYKENIVKVLEEQQFDISIFISKTMNKQYLKDYGHLLKVISSAAKMIWFLQMDLEMDKKNIEIDTVTIDNTNDAKCCLETGILMKTLPRTLGRTRSHIIFSHTLLFDLFVALSYAIDKGESFRRCITTKKAVIRNSSMIHILCQLSPNIGQELIMTIRAIFDKDNDMDGNEKTEGSDLRFICNIECSNLNLQTPVKWLMSLLCMDELSNGKLSILTEGSKFTKEITCLVLKFPENKNHLIFKLPILPKIQSLKIDIANCTLLLHEEQKWNKGNCSEIGELVIQSVNIDLKTIGYLINAISTSKNLHTLALCPKDDSDTQTLELKGQTTFYGWKRLAGGILDMTKLSTVRLHNLHLGDDLPAFLKCLCRCPSMETLDFMNLNEIDTGEFLKINASYQTLLGCKHHEIISSMACKTLHLIRNKMSQKSFLTLSEQIEFFSPHIVHIEYVHHSILIVKEIIQGLGKCKDLTVLFLCSIHAGNHNLSFFSLRHLHKLEKLTLCKITMSDSSWKGLSETLERLTELKELSLAHLDIKNCFIEVHKLSKVKHLEMRKVHLREALWSQFGDGVIMLPNLETLELVYCQMSKQKYSFILDKIKHSNFNMEMEKKSKLEGSEILSIDMIVRRKEVKPRNK